MRRTQWRLAQTVREVEDNEPRPDVQLPAERPAWRLMEESLRACREAPARPRLDDPAAWVQSSSSPLDAFEAAAARLGAPLRADDARGCALGRPPIHPDDDDNYPPRRRAPRWVDDDDDPPYCVYRGEDDGATLTLTHVKETLDAALYTFTKSYQAKEQREKEARDAVDKARAEERKQLEKEVREEHSLRLIEAAAAFEEIADVPREGSSSAHCRAACPCFCLSAPTTTTTTTTTTDLVADDLAPPRPQWKSLSDASQNVQHELDMALAMMQKRLGGDKPFVGHDRAEYVPKPPDVKPDDAVAVATTTETPDERERRELAEKRAMEDEEFERRCSSEAEKKCDAGFFDQLGTPATDDNPDLFATDDNPAGDFDLETDEAIDRLLYLRDLASEPRAVPRLAATAREDDDAALLASRDDHFAFSARTSPAALQSVRRVEGYRPPPDPHDPVARAQTRLDENRQRRRLTEAKGILDHALDARARLEKARTLRVALRGELRRHHDAANPPSESVGAASY